MYEIVLNSVLVCFVALKAATIYSKILKDNQRQQTKKNRIAEKKMPPISLWTTIE